MKQLIFIILLLNSSSLLAEQTMTFGIVPQQSASKLARLWTPILNYISQQTGRDIQFATAADIPTFEKRLAEGEYDFAYMNPYHYVVFHEKRGYQALNKARDKQIKGIIIVAKNSDIQNLKDLDNSTLAFPAPAAFAASILTRNDLTVNDVTFTPKYVSSHDSVYRAVAKGLHPGGGGIVRTFNNTAPEVREKLKVLWTTKGYTPHAIAAHPRTKQNDIDAVQKALTAMENESEGKSLLQTIKVKGFDNASDRDWDDVRSLQLDLLSDL